MAKGEVDFKQVLIILGFLILALIIFLAANKIFSLYG
jgi:hypothetical protein